MLSRGKYHPSKNNSHFKKTLFCILFIIIFSILIQYSGINANEQKNQLTISNLDNNSPRYELEPNRIRLYLSNIDVKNGLAFIEHVDDEITIFDISNPKLPRVKSIITIPQLAHFVVDNDSLYTFSHHNDEQTILQIFDITNPKEPKEIQSYNLTEKGYSRDAFIFDNSLFVAQTNDSYNSDELFYVSLTKIILSSPLSEVNIYKKNGFNDTGIYRKMNVDIFCLEDSAFLAIEKNGIIHLNLTDNSLINEYLNSTLSPIEMTIYENNLFVSDNTFGLKIFDYKNYSNLTQIGSFSEENGFGSFCIADDYFYVSFRAGGIKILDIADSTTPIEVSEISYLLLIKSIDSPYSSDYAKGVFIQGNYLLIGEDFNDLLIYDISNPFQPIEVKVNYLLVFWSLISVVVVIGIFFGVDYTITKKNQAKKMESSFQYPIVVNSVAKEKPIDVAISKEYNPTLIKFLRLCFIIFIAQNVSALVFLTINFLFLETGELSQPYYFINVPLILDIIVGLAILVIMSLLYFERRKINLLICAFMWLLWIGIALFYRIYAGMPGFAKLDQIVWGSNLDVNYPYGNTFWISFFFVLNLTVFWFATYYTDKAINAIYQKNKIMKFAIFGTANLIVGTFAAIVLLLFKDYNDISILFIGFAFLILVVIKIIIIPIIGGVMAFIEQRTINKVLLSNKEMIE
ncbi:MAG TPA: hypothetical protein VMZ29_12320 [Candidatus Bathyarchaeia archaeon]|nr:hypothetical protein [Candidatus Bathyarchaeia archaeon]